MAGGGEGGSGVDGGHPPSVLIPGGQCSRSAGRAPPMRLTDPLVAPAPPPTRDRHDPRDGRWHKCDAEAWYVDAGRAGLLDAGDAVRLTGLTVAFEGATLGMGVGGTAMTTGYAAAGPHEQGRGRSPPVGGVPVGASWPTGHPTGGWDAVAGRVSGPRDPYPCTSTLARPQDGIRASRRASRPGDGAPRGARDGRREARSPFPYW
jgi:hypothetical protein